MARASTTKKKSVSRSIAWNVEESKKSWTPRSGLSSVVVVPAARGNPLTSPSLRCAHAGSYSRNLPSAYPTPKNTMTVPATRASMRAMVRSTPRPPMLPPSHAVEQVQGPGDQHGTGAAGALDGDGHGVLRRSLLDGESGSRDAPRQSLAAERAVLAAAGGDHRVDVRRQHGQHLVDRL